MKTTPAPQEPTAADALAELLAALGFNTMAKECREGKAAPTRFTGLVLREVERRHPDKLKQVRRNLQALGLIHF